MSNKLPLPKTETLAAGSASATVRSTKSTHSKVQSRSFVNLGHVFVGIWAVLAAIAPTTQPNFAQFLEHQIQTLFFEARGRVEPPRDIIILALDTFSASQGRLFSLDPVRYAALEPLQTSPPKRAGYAIAINRLMSAGAQTVALDVILDLPSGHGPNDDQQLQHVLKRYPGRVTLAATYEDINNQISREGDLTQLTTPNALFRTTPESIGFINFPLAPDGRIYNLGSQYPKLVAQSYKDSQFEKAVQDLSQVFSFAEATLQSAQRPFPTPRGQNIFFFGPSGTFKHVPFWQVLDTESWQVHLKEGTFKNKLVLIGPTADVYQDFHAAPFSKSFLHPNPLAGVEIHANAIATLMEDKSIAEAFPNPIVQGLVVLIIVLGAGYVQGRRKRPFLRLLLAGGAVLAWGIVGYGVFVYGRLILPTALPMGAIILSGISYMVTGSLGEYLRKVEQRRTFARYADSPIVQEMLSQMDGFQDLLREREQEIFGKKLAGRYRIIKVLGSGGFGETYVAEDTQRPGNPLCVVKLLRPASNNPNLLRYARELFDREAKTLEKLGKHDRIPQLLAYFEEEEKFYLAQEFIEGKPLSSELSLGKQLPEATVIGILQELLQILEFVHSQGVIHRDIKPSNIIRRKSDNQLVLIDFGAVKEKLTAEETDRTNFTVGIGTQGYMPNEQCAGNPRPNSDIYAIGMTGIQALTGLPPSQLKHDPYTGEILWRGRANVSHTLADVLGNMVRYDFTKRYQSVSEVLQSLSELATLPATSSTPPEVLSAPSESFEADTFTANLDGLTETATKPWPDAFGSDAEEPPTCPAPPLHSESL